MAKALVTQPSSMRPLSMKRSRRARTRTSTAASAKKDEQRCAEMAISSTNGVGPFATLGPLPEGTSVRRAGGVRGSMWAVVPAWGWVRVVSGVMGEMLLAELKRRL